MTTGKLEKCLPPSKFSLKEVRLVWLQEVKDRPEMAIWLSLSLGVLFSNTPKKSIWPGFLGRGLGKKIRVQGKILSVPKKFKNLKP